MEISYLTIIRHYTSHARSVATTTARSLARNVVEYSPRPTSACARLPQRDAKRRAAQTYGVAMYDNTVDFS